MNLKSLEKTYCISALAYLVENGDIYLVYDYERYGARQILLAVFTEADILAGTIISKNGRLRRVISTAEGGRGGVGENE